MELEMTPYPKLAPRPLKPALLRLHGISTRQVQDHYALYQDDIAKVNEIHDKLLTVDCSTAHPTYSALRALKVALGFALDSVKLHQAFFENLGGAGGEPVAKSRALLDRDFGSAAQWLADFRATAACAHGWAVLAYDLDDARLHNFVADDHATGAIWNAVPVLVLDLCEHAYAIDYGIDRASYFDAFLTNVDWAVVNARLASLRK